MRLHNFITGSRWKLLAVVLCLLLLAGCSGEGNEKPRTTQPQTTPPGTVQTGQPDTPPDTQGQQPEQPPATTAPPGTTGSQGGDPEPTPIQPEPDLKVQRIASFSGAFVEDGSDQAVENVAAILVKNRTEKFLDLGTVTYDVEGKTAVFIVTGLPAGESAWVLEYSGMVMDPDKSMRYAGCSTSFREDVIAASEEVTFRQDGNMLQATNHTDRTLENVFVYYKTLHSDGNYFGGIAYAVNFGTIAPGQTVEKLAGHYDISASRIVRIGWQESQTAS